MFIYLCLYLVVCWFNSCARLHDTRSHGLFLKTLTKISCPSLLHTPTLAS